MQLRTCFPRRDARYISAGGVAGFRERQNEEDSKGSRLGRRILTFGSGFLCQLALIVSIWVQEAQGMDSWSHYLPILVALRMLIARSASVLQESRQFA